MHLQIDAKMLFKQIFFPFLFVLCLFLISNSVESRAVQFHSDAIETHWPTTESTELTKEEQEPGFMRKQLLRFGRLASRVGNAMGTHATKITSAVDKVCEIVKTVIPLLAAVCHVGQFKFCAATNEAPQQLTQALSPNTLDLNIPD